MSTESVRNEITNTIQKAIVKAKGEIKTQGKKKVLELKKKIPSPQEVIDELKSEISEDNCTGEGKEKFEKKIKNLENKIDRIKTAIDNSLDKLETVDGKLKKITDPSGVLAKINSIAEVLNPIVATLGTAVIIAKIMIKIYGHIPLPPNGAGPPSGPIFLAKEIADLAGGKIAEFSALILSLGLIVQLYTNKITKMLNIITIAIDKLKALKAMIDKLAALLLFLKLEQEAACEELLSSDTGATGTGTGDPSGTGIDDGTGAWNDGGLGTNTINGNNIASLADGLSLEDLIAQSENLYDGLLNTLKAQGNEKALEKVSRLEKETNEWVTKYNISFKIIKI